MPSEGYPVRFTGETQGGWSNRVKIKEAMTALSSAEKMKITPKSSRVKWFRDMSRATTTHTDNLWVGKFGLWTDGLS